ncbi:hypothetical protein BYT27DRAFT_7167332 [Phlegmacium glaucopus]|nr:hypothetical protein BYT27DRAFT_7167332 [Phlegmacium glaucopus]
MLVQGGSRHFVKRSDPIIEPTGAGISSVSTATATTTATTGLVFDPSQTGSFPTAPLLAFPQSTTPTTSQTSATQSADAASAPSSKSISLGAVIGSCVGAFIVVSILIILGIWFYRRYSASLKKQAKARGRVANDRNLETDKQRRRSRLEPWNKLEEGKDKWEDTHQTKEVNQVVPMEKLTMFKRGASVRTAYTQKSVDETPLTYPQSFAPFDANLVRKLSADDAAVPHPRPSLNTKGQTSNLSPSNTLGEPLSPSLNMAIPTPEATVLQPHKWESAEVVHYAEGQSAEAVEPSSQDKDVRSTQNPFFGSQDHVSRSNTPNAKGKERMHDSMMSSDPFEALDTPLSKPVFVHQATDSSTSSRGKDRALQALIAALDLPEDEVRERLRVASMQPSVISPRSLLPGDEEDFVRNFRLPPPGGNVGKF